MADHALRIADLGWKQAIDQDSNLRQGLNVCTGRVTHPEVAEQHGLEYAAPEAILAN